VAQPNAALPSLSPTRTFLAAIILFTTGFTSMAMEVVWTRAFTPVLGTQVYAFALLLFVYLLATWIGSLAYRRGLARSRVWETAPIIALLAFAALLPLLMNDPRVLFHSSGALLSIFPFCALLGYLTPKLIDGYSRGNPKGVGVSYAVNIFGCILGPLAASYVLLPMFGLKYVLLILASPYLLLALYFLTAGEMSARLGRWCTVATLLAFGISFGIKTYEDRAFGADARPPLVRRDHTATVVSFGEGLNKRLLVNGVGITSLVNTTKVMAHLPLAQLPEPPTSALIICFGMGTTWRSALSWKINVTAVELVPSVREAFPFYFDDAPALLAKPNGKIVVDDGRRFLRRTSESFDLITIDPPPPVSAAGSSLLYSDEFYETAKLRLKPKGILQQWILISNKETMQAAVRSLLRAFPHVRMYVGSQTSGIHCLASRSPLEHLTFEELAAKMPVAAQADLAEWSNEKDAAAVLRASLTREIDPRTFVGDGVDRVTDDHPLNEYYLVRRLRNKLQRSWGANTENRPSTVASPLAE
jgi:spermidine synthase